MNTPCPAYDLLVVGGGINGAGIARDAAGRGLSVLLAEKDDLAQATSSASSKLIHGGLRYLEQYEFRLVAEALAEREVLLKIAPHLVAPLSFVIPHVPELRPRWMIRAGLFLYDHLGRRTQLHGSRSVDLHTTPYGAGLKSKLRNGFIYSDCRVDDARLVVANAMCARAHGADIRTRTECVLGKRDHDGWQIKLRTSQGASQDVKARAVVNAAGPWVKEVLNDRLHHPSNDNVRLVKGSHIVVPQAYSGEHAFILQNDDGRVVFMIPYRSRYTLIGTTDIPVTGDPSDPRATAAEIAYLCAAANRYLKRAIAPADVVWSYSGIRPLYDDGTANPSSVTRDYTLRLDAAQGEAPVLSIFGGKITTYRRLAEHALEQLAPWFPQLKPAWTHNAPLPGGDFKGTPAAFRSSLANQFPGVPRALINALTGRHGSLTSRVLDGVRDEHDLGTHFGADLYSREVDYMVSNEWAQTAADVLYRRTKYGFEFDAAQHESLTRHLLYSTTSLLQQLTVR